MIPRILQLHWLWEDWPPFAEEAVSRWYAMLPDWEIMLIEEVPEDFPEEFRSFLEEPRIPPANRADLFRNWSLWRYGGIYADLDALPIKPPDEWLLNRRCFIPHGTFDTHDPSGQFIDSCFIGSEAGHPFWHSVWECCRHPEAWKSATQWFCGVNTFRFYAQYGVDLLPGLCQEVTQEERLSFVDNASLLGPAEGMGYIKHFRASKTLACMGILPTHWADHGTWRSVYGEYPCERDGNGPCWDNVRYSRVRWG